MSTSIVLGGLTATFDPELRTVTMSGAAALSAGQQAALAVWLASNLEGLARPALPRIGSSPVDADIGRTGEIAPTLGQLG